MASQREVRDQLQAYWKKYGLSLESQTKAMNVATEVIEKLNAKLEEYSNEEAG